MSHPRAPYASNAHLFSPAASIQHYNDMVAARTFKVSAPTYYSENKHTTMFKPEDLKYAEIEKNMTSVEMSDLAEKKSGCC